MRYRYRITRSNVIIEGCKYNTYGIICTKGFKHIIEVNDISLNINDINSLCDFLNKNDISPVHFIDIIEDYLAK